MSWRELWDKDGWVRPFLKQYKKALALSLVLGVLALAFNLGLMTTSGFLISDAAEQPALGLYSLLIPLGMVQVFGIGKPFLGYFERLTSHGWVLRITSLQRRDLYSLIEKKGIFWNATHRAGDLLGLLAGDLDHIQNLYVRTVFPLVIAWVMGIIVVIALGFFSLPFALLMLVMLVVMTILLPLLSMLVNRQRQMRAAQRSQDQYACMYDCIAGLPDWKYAQRPADFLETPGRIAQDIDTDEATTAASLRRNELLLKLIFGVTATLLLVWAALHFGSTPQPPAATGVAARLADWIAAFVLGFFPLLEAFSPLPSAAAFASGNLDSLERLNALDAAEDEEVLETTSPTLTGSAIHIQGLGFSYEGKAVLAGIDLDIVPGEKLAILGPSGVGKSTLLSLIRGDLTPGAGTVSIGGVPAQDLGDSAAQVFGCIQQSTYLFNQTLYENLTLGDEGISREQCQAVLEEVRLSQLLTRLPQGLDTLVEEGGSNFSAGEAHRIALARVLLRNTPIILLDEPCADLDPLTEIQLLDTLFRALEGRTVIMVTHHLMGVSGMDRVVFLDEGHITLQGSPKELEQTNPRYQQLLAFDRGPSLG